MSYSAKDIGVLEGLEAVRVKPGMYIGTNDSQGIFQITKEIIDNVFDEYLAGFNSNIYLETDGDTVTVADTSRGVPVEIHPKTKESTLTTIFTRLHAGGKLAKGSAYKTTVGCFVGDTLITLVNDVPTKIQDLYERFTRTGESFDVFSHAEGNEVPVVRKCYNVQLSKYVDTLAKVVFDNGNIVLCTIDHPFLSENEEYVEAQKLKVGDLIISSYMLRARPRYYKCLPKLTVEKVEIVNLHESVPVYGMSVEGEHNYLLDAGVFVKNTHGLGASACNALSDSFQVWTYRKAWYYQSFSKGKPTSKVIKKSPPKVCGKTVPNGTIIRFKPDYSCFVKGSKLNTKKMLEWLDVCSYLYPKLKFWLDIKGKKIKLHQPTGIQALVNKMLDEVQAEKLGKTIVINTDHYDAVLQWSSFEDEKLNSYVNGSRTIEGGTHVNGLFKAITDALKPFKGAKSSCKPEDLRCGLLGVLDVKISSPQFDSQTKTKLTTKDAQDLVYDSAFKELTSFFKKNPGTAKDIVKRANEIRSVVQAFSVSKKAAASLKVKKGGKVFLPSKLVASTTTDPTKREIFLVEGDSAGGSAERARDPKTQEVLKLKGKIINVYKNKIDKAFQNAEVLDILKSIGYDPSTKSTSYRVGKIVLLTDADPDGPLYPDTLVRMVDGPSRTIKSLADEYKITRQPFNVWGVGLDGKLKEAVALDPRVTIITQEVVTLFVDNNKTPITSTLYHKYAMIGEHYNGDSRSVKIGGINYIEALNLRDGDTIAGNNPDEFTATPRTVTQFAYNIIPPQEMYCMTVPETGNFMIDTKDGKGLCSSNCHISSLLLGLFLKVMPDVFEKGMVYALYKAPLFTTTLGKNRIYAKTLTELMKKTGGKGVVTRIKGWGETSAQVLREIAFDPTTRYFVKITLDDAKQANRFISVMGEDVSTRKEMLGV